MWLISLDNMNVKDTPQQSLLFCTFWTHLKLKQSWFVCRDTSHYHWKTMTFLRLLIGSLTAVSVKFSQQIFVIISYSAVRLSSFIQAFFRYFYPDQLTSEISFPVIPLLSHTNQYLLAVDVFLHGCPPGLGARWNRFKMGFFKFLDKKIVSEILMTKTPVRHMEVEIFVNQYLRISGRKMFKCFSAGLWGEEILFDRKNMNVSLQRPIEALSVTLSSISESTCIYYFMLQTFQYGVNSEPKILKTKT